MTKINKIYLTNIRDHDFYLTWISKAYNDFPAYYLLFS